MNTFHRRPYPLDKAHTCQSQTMSRSHFDRWKSWTLDSDAMGPLKKKRMRLRDESRKEKKLDKMAKSVWSAGNIHSSILTLPVHFFFFFIRSAQKHSFATTMPKDEFEILLLHTCGKSEGSNDSFEVIPKRFQGGIRDSLRNVRVNRFSAR